MYIRCWIWNVASAREWDFTTQMVWWHCAVAHLRGNTVHGHTQTGQVDSGVAWAIWLCMQFLVCVSMTSKCSVNSGTICLQKLPSNCDSNTMLYLSEFQLLHTGPDLADARP